MSVPQLAQMSRYVRRLRWGVFLISLPFGALMFMLPLVGRGLGASALEISGLFSIFALATVVIRPLVGRALDLFGRKPFFLAGLFSYSLANLLYAISGEVGMLYVARLAQGVGSGLMWLSAYAIVSDLAGSSERGGRFGQIEEMAPRGGILGVFMIFGLMTFFGYEAGWKYGFFLFTLIGMVAFLFSALRIPETKGLFFSDAGGEQLPGLLPQNLNEVKRMLSWPFVVLLAVIFLSASAYAIIGPILMIYLVDHVTQDITSLALAYLPAALLSATLPSRLGRLSDRWGRRAPMALALLVGGIVSFSIPQVRSLFPLIILWMAEAACFAAATPAQEALVTDLSPPGHRGLAFGLYTASASLGAVIGPLLGGWMYGSLGEGAPFFLNAGLLWASAAAVLLFLRLSPASPSLREKPSG